MSRAGLYVPLDVNFPDDDRIEEVGPEAAGIYTFALCLAKRLGSDGRVTRNKLMKLGGTRASIGALVLVGLLIESEDDPGALVIAAWLDHNAPMSDIQQRRADDAQRKRLSRANRPGGHGETSARTPRTRPKESLLSRVERSEVETERTNPPQAAGSVAVLPKPKTDPPGFAEWYALYPLKRSPRDAAKAYVKARKIASQQALLDGVKAYIKYHARPLRPGDFRPAMAHPASWLNRGEWENDYSELRQPVNTGVTDTYR